MFGSVSVGCGTAKSGIFGTPKTTLGNVPRVHLPRSQIVLRVQTGGGYTPIESLLGSVASLVVYGDGRVIKPDPRGPHRPGDLIRFRVGRIDQRVLDELVARFERSGFFSGAKVDFGDPRITDAATTSVRFRGTGARSVVVAAYALGDQFGRPVHGTAAKRRADLRRLLAWADNATETEAPHPYTPERVLVYEVSADSELSSRQSGVAPWPGPDLERLFDRDPHRLSWTCAMVQGPSVAPIVAAAQRRASGTLWRWRGRHHRLVLRTLLPGEPGCER